MPPGFSFLDKSVDVWLPIGFTAQSRTPRGRSLTVVGRLKPGVTVARAQLDMTRVSANLTQMFPAFNTGWTSRVVPLREQLTGDVRPALLVLAARRRLRSADRLRQRRQPPAGARDGAPARARRARRARRRAGAARRQLLAESLVLSVHRRRLRAAPRMVGTRFPPRRRRRAAANSATRDGRHRSRTCCSSRSPPRSSAGWSSGPCRR